MVKTDELFLEDTICLFCNYSHQFSFCFQKLDIEELSSTDSMCYQKGQINCIFWRWKNKRGAHSCPTFDTETDRASCPYSVLISFLLVHVFLKLIDMDRTEQFHQRSWGGGQSSQKIKWVDQRIREGKLNNGGTSWGHPLRVAKKLQASIWCYFTQTQEQKVAFASFWRATLSQPPPPSPCLLLSETLTSALPSNKSIAE